MIMKTFIYKEFVNEIIKSAIYLLETKYKEEAWKNSNYNGLEKSKLKMYTGLDYYPMITFILERLISIFVLNNPKYSFKNLI